MSKELGNIYKLFDLICGTSTGGMLAVALTVKQMTLDQCEEIYKKLGKLVFAEPTPKDEAATWREKLDQLYKSSSQSFRVVVHGSKHNADQFERLLKEMCADDDGDLLIESSIKNIPKVFVVSTLVSVTPAQPFLFRNYQYPTGTPEQPPLMADSHATGTTIQNAQVGAKRGVFMGSCKHRIWEAIRASSAAPYYLDDFSDDVHRWQDGAIVANNPTIFAIREAQLLWPDSKIDCLVSLGCGSVPTKIRKGGWRYLDTGQVLIESACSTDRVEEALDTLIPLLPDVHYYRFNPVGERCDMELDETDPAIWLKLESETEEYIQKNINDFKSVCDRLLARYQNDDKTFEQVKTHFSSKTNSLHPGPEESKPSLGRRRMVLLVESLNNPDTGKTINHARSLETFCARNNIKLALTIKNPGIYKAIPVTAPFSSSPLFTGSFPSSPLKYSPEYGPRRTNHIDLVPPLSLDGKLSFTPPASPSLSWHPSVHVRSLHEKLQNMAQIGVIHLSLQNDSTGSILSWQNDVFVVAEPGDLADKFLQNVKLSLTLLFQGRRKKNLAFISNISSISDLVAQYPKFQIGGIIHRYIGRQTQVMEDNQEIGAFMFRRTVPAVHLTPQDVRWMVGSWRDRIIIYTSRCGPSSSLIKAFFDSGAKAVIASTAEPYDTKSLAFHEPSEEYNLENGKFVIGDEEEADEAKEQEADQEPTSPMSDWEEIDAENSINDNPIDWNDGDEEYLSKFVCLFYDILFREGASVDVALHNALQSFPRLRYTCHLPR